MVRIASTGVPWRRSEPSGDAPSLRSAFADSPGAEPPARLANQTREGGGLGGDESCDTLTYSLTVANAHVSASNFHIDSANACVNATYQCRMQTFFLTTI